MKEILPYIQIVLSLVLIGSILIQQRGAGMGAAFGGGSDGGAHTQRRGVEKYIFYVTIVLGIAFFLTSFASLFLE
ncbi:MAG: preprotein translocase subunit SecG [bacterium]|nr:preprotein translocase subunit SecG [bacterium]